jgi:hypothetical protein
VKDYADQWVVVAEYSNHSEAELAKNLLHSSGVRSRIWSDDCGGLAIGQMVVQGVRLLVKERDIDESRHILGAR